MVHKKLRENRTGPGSLSSEYKWCGAAQCNIMWNNIHVYVPSQVHANNILRALYRQTTLGEAVFPFVSDGVVVAINGFHSESWAVSTCSSAIT